jgi:hypothetical protein
VVALGLFFASGVLLFTGCSDGTWNRAYQAGYDQAYQTAIETRPVRGAEGGAELGAAEARQAVTTGFAWRLYAPFVYGAVFPGIVVGLVVQYSILFNCRLSERLPPPALFAFVPAMKASLCYKFFDHRFRVVVEFDKQLNRLLATRKLEIAKGDAAYEAARRRIMAASSIQEVSTARCVEIAHDELAKIIADAEKASESEKTKSATAKEQPGVCKCPHCGKRIQFSERKIGRTVKCPYPKCGHQFRVTSPE